MAYNYEYPHFEAPQYNMDWILETIKRIEEQVLGLDNYNYEGENEILDLNDLKPNSMASFTENFNVLNAPLSGVRRFVFTNGSDTGGFQRCYDLQNLETYERVFTIVNGLTTFSPWEKTQNAPGLDIHNMNRFEKGSVNELPINTVVLVYNTSAVTDGATNNIAHVMTFKSPNDGSIIQVWFDLGNFFIYLRSCLNGKWTAWVEANHIDLTNYYKYLGAANVDLNSLRAQSVYLCNANNPNLPSSFASAIVITIGVPAYRRQIAIPVSNQSKALYREAFNDTWSNWYDPINNENVLHRLSNTWNSNDIYGARFSSSNFSSGGFTGYGAIIGIGYSTATSDTYQIGLSSSNRLFSRFRNGSTWGEMQTYQWLSNREILIATNVIEEIHTLEDGGEIKTHSQNIYSEIENEYKTQFIALPGQSLLHSDEGEQSFKEVIMDSDISNTDMIITNFELWDMDIPLTEIGSTVLDLLVWMRNQNPMCDITLMSIPPVDIPLWGDEFLDYEMPNGSTVRQLDEEMLKLAEDYDFTYIAFNDFYASQNTNLLEYLGDDMKSNKQYLRRVASFLKNRIM